MFSIPTEDPLQHTSTREHNPDEPFWSTERTRYQPWWVWKSDAEDEDDVPPPRRDDPEQPPRPEDQPNYERYLRRFNLRALHPQPLSKIPQTIPQTIQFEGPSSTTIDKCVLASPFLFNVRTKLFERVTINGKRLRSATYTPLIASIDFVDEFVKILSQGFCLVLDFISNLPRKKSPASQKN